MPKFVDDSVAMATHNIGGSTFAFTAADIKALGAEMYTLGVVVVDVSGSTAGYRKQMESALAEIVKACRLNPRADSMMLRVVTFDTQLKEYHGFKPLPNCNELDYVDSCVPGGYTCLYDAVYEAVHSCIEYGKQLSSHDYTVNAAIFVITDGEDNMSRSTAKMCKDAFAEATHSEALESLMSVLIGVGATGSLNSYLQAFKDEAGFQQYVAIGDADEKTLAKVGGFISLSMSSQSKALGTGGGSQSLTF